MTIDNKHSMNDTVMMVAGEASGDLHGSGLIRELKGKRPTLRLFGIGGNKMQARGMELIYHINEMSVLGLWDVVKRFRFFKRVYRNLVDRMDSEKPRVLVLIDYPGLNLKLAKAAHQRGIKVLYYIAPQVWAWGAQRIKQLALTVDKMAVILPFEEKMYRDAGVEATFVGHPLLEILETKLSKKEFCAQHRLNPNQKTIGLLAGSRRLEVSRLLPTMLETVRLLKNKYPAIQIIASKAEPVPLDIYQGILADSADIKLVEHDTYEIMKYSDLLMVASGTATLEAALFETPLIVVYKVDAFSYVIGKQLVKIDTIGLVNVIAEEKIVPEFIQHKFQPKKLLPEIEELLFNQDRKQKMVKKLSVIKQKLGQRGASKRAAQMVLELL